MPKYQTSIPAKNKMQTELDYFDKTFNIPKGGFDPEKDGLFKVASSITRTASITEKKRAAVARVKKNFNRTLTEDLSDTDLTIIKKELEDDAKVLSETDLKNLSMMDRGMSVAMNLGVYDRPLTAYTNAMHGDGTSEINVTQGLVTAIRKFTSELKPISDTLDVGIKPSHLGKLNATPNPSIPLQASKTDQQYNDAINKKIFAGGEPVYLVEKKPTDHGFVITSKKDGEDTSHLDVTVSPDKKVSATIKKDATPEEKDHLIKKLVAAYMIEHNPKSIEGITITSGDQEVKKKIEAELNRQIFANMKDQNPREPSNKNNSEQPKINSDESSQKRFN